MEDIQCRIQKVFTAFSQTDHRLIHLYVKDGRIETKAMWHRTPFLSNFFPMAKFGKDWLFIDAAPITITWKGKNFTHVEGSYQYAKRDFFSSHLSGPHATELLGKDVLSAEQAIQAAGVLTEDMERLSPVLAQQQGSQKAFVSALVPQVLSTKAQAIRIFRALTPLSRQHNVQIMKCLLLQKFGPQNPLYHALLKATDGLDLVESKFRGSVWEMGSTVSLTNPPSGLGLLGELLMAVRHEIM